MLSNNNKPIKLSHAKPAPVETLAEIDVDAIVNNPQQPRLHINVEDLEELAKSIAEHGLIQPISVIKKHDKFILQAGQRRWLAHKSMGLKTIKAIVYEESILAESENEKSLFEIAIIENTQRENLDSLELALSFKNALDANLYKNNKELSHAVGKSSSYISKVLKVLSLDNKIIEDLRKNQSTNDVESLYEIQKIQNRKKQQSVYSDFINKKIDRKSLRELNRSKKDASSEKSLYKFTGRAKVLKLEFDTTNITDKEIQDMKDEIEEVLKKYIPQ